MLDMGTRAGELHALVNMFGVDMVEVVVVEKPQLRGRPGEYQSAQTRQAAADRGAQRGGEARDGAGDREYRGAATSLTRKLPVGILRRCLFALGCQAPARLT